MEWDKLFKREAAALEGEMREKRKKGKAKLTLDAFGRVRELLKARRQASYLAKAQAVVVKVSPPPNFKPRVPLEPRASDVEMRVQIIGCAKEQH